MVRAPAPRTRRAFVRGQREACASQRIAMQTDPYFPFAPLGLTLGALEDAFQRAHAHARSATPHRPADIATACPVSRGDSSKQLDAHDEPLLDGAELLRAVREPIEWLLTLAHRLAAGELEEVAAVDRL